MLIDFLFPIWTSSVMRRYSLQCNTHSVYVCVLGPPTNHNSAYTQCRITLHNVNSAQSIARITFDVHMGFVVPFVVFINLVDKMYMEQIFWIPSNVNRWKDVKQTTTIRRPDDFKFRVQIIQIEHTATDTKSKWPNHAINITTFVIYQHTIRCCTIEPRSNWMHDWNMPSDSRWRRIMAIKNGSNIYRASLIFQIGLFFAISKVARARLNQSLHGRYLEHGASDWAGHTGSIHTYLCLYI